MSGEPRLPAAPVSPVWEILKHGGSDPRLAGEAADPADLLKVLLAGAMRVLDEDPGALLVLRRPAADGPAEALLDGLAAMGLDGLIMDERAASLLPPPYRAERIGFLPGISAEPFCAHRLESRAAAAAVEVPARAALWDELQRRIAAAEGYLTLRIAGPAGAGKSHLIGSLAAALAAQGREVLQVACLPTDVPGTFAAWRALLAQAGRPDSLAGDISATGAELTLDPVLVGNLVRFLVGPAAGTEMPDGGLTPLQYKDILPEFIAAVFARRVAGRAVVAVIDDIQWMDEGSHGVLEAVVRAAPPVLLVLGRRGQAAADETAVGPMSVEEHRALLSDLAGGAEITDALNDEIRRISGGLPLVSREVFALLGKRRRLLSMGGTLDLAAGEELPAERGGTPLTERFRDLSPRLRSLLGACAVWREPFSRAQAETTARACHPGIDFEACWASSQLGEFLVAAPGAAGRFRFYHDLLREAALSLMPDRERAAGHGAALEWMMKVLPPQELSPAEAAFHARESGRDETAVELFDQAARAALGRFALREARETARAALELDRDGEGDPVAIARRARRLQIEGEAAFHWGMVEDAVNLLEKALVLYGVSPR
jgi:hypothetical protein